jgi:hemoglobin-like flavoprotein
MAAPSPRPQQVSDEAMRLAKSSFERCCEVPDFFICFYRNFFRQSPTVEPLFAKTDFTRQHRLLRHAIGLLLIFPHQPVSEPSLLERVATRHSRRDLGIDPSLYPDFVESLIHTVAEHDPEFSSEVEHAWRETIAPGIAYMRAAY